jgi:BlaI family penicillinase repressor
MNRPPQTQSPRRSLLDLAPLELDCMNTLWPMGEATVREIRDRLAERRARAYTTIMTIMDRLARKGVVERRKTGRAYVYKPRLSAAEARAQALAQVLDGFFAGSKEALLAQLENENGTRNATGPSATPVDGGDAAGTFPRERLDNTVV